jgi:hypothetical protein
MIISVKKSSWDLGMIPGDVPILHKRIDMWTIPQMQEPQVTCCLLGHVQCNLNQMKGMGIIFFIFKLL